ncbi:outer membrane beta-barrel family protein [Flavobacterium rakeshii]|uniref:outer membrane beta-barrel family protein n=1 Tax=Flavobacterium rakeshii TaxID=1038845 RepID=UPI002E7AC055|nr:outer membrane beta-barrel family protein [Flavobacterium rakeshii]MEE1896708.1 outer membrane beta-barrel family protein [Flavobacterium rakeshii]
MKKILFITLILFTTVSALAQTKIKGVVKEQNTNSVSFASVYITHAETIIAYTETDDSGSYTLNIPAKFTIGTLTVSFLGFVTYTQEISIINLPQEINIILTPQQEQLNEIVIDVQQKAMSMKGDKTIFNVEAAGIGNGNNGLETIQLVPGMHLDKDENLVYRGSADLQIMINGKKSLLTGDALREYIRSLKGSDIKSIEIISQPSARYEAAGTAGIINIVLKKNYMSGLSGSVNTAAYYGEYFKNQQGGRLFYNDSFWTITANGSYYNGESVNHRHIKQSIAIEEGERIIDQYNTWLPVTKSESFNTAIERKINLNQVISTEWQYYKVSCTETTNGYTNEYLNNTPQNRVNLSQHFNAPESRVSGNLFYNFTSDSLATKLDLQANFAQYSTERNGFQRNDYADKTYLNLDGKNKTAYTITNVQADFNQKLTNNINLETGAKYAYVKMDYYNGYEANNTALLFIPDSLLVNDFKYNEKLASVYLQASAEFGYWNVQAGLRAEYYRFTAASPLNAQVNKGEYTNLFPSFSFGYKNENHQYQFSYSRRIGRPDYLSLNPYYQYIDAYTLQTGNSALSPQYYNSFQLNYIYKSMLNISLYGYLFKNGFTQVINYQRDKNYNITYDANAANGNRFGFSVSVPYQPVKWWTVQLSLDTYLNSEKSDIENFTYKGSGYGYDINLYQGIELKGDWKLTANGFYNGRSTTPNGFSKATYDISLSGKKSLLNKKLVLTAGCSNILKKSIYNHTTQVNNVSTDWTNRWETRRFFVQATYYFGSGKSKEVKSTSLDEETNRI